MKIEMLKFVFDKPHRFSFQCKRREQDSWNRRTFCWKDGIHKRYTTDYITWHGLYSFRLKVALKMITGPFCALSRVCLRLCFESCKTTQNVTFHDNLHDVIQISLNKDMVSGW